MSKDNMLHVRRSRTGFIGVDQAPPAGRFRVRIGRGREYLASYATAEEAAHAYDLAALERYGTEAILNFPNNIRTKPQAMNDMPTIVGPIDEDSISGRNIVTEDASDPNAKPKPADPAKPAWTWRKGAEWKKGQSGNPSGINGRTYRNKAALAAEGLFDGEVEGLTRRCVEMALADDPACMKICIDRLLPPARSRPITFKLPTLHTIADAQNALSAIIAGTACGAILADEAATLASIVSSFVKTIEVAELESRLAALEKASAGSPMARFDA